MTRAGFAFPQIFGSLFEKKLRSRMTTRNVWPHSYTMNLRRDVFQALADPTRRAILLLVAAQALPAGAIAAHFDTARPTVSKHLQILTECELLRAAPVGREIYYHLNPKKMKEIADFIEPFRKLWEDRFDRLKTVMKRYQTKK